jgi:hypothetical protein
LLVGGLGRDGRGEIFRPPIGVGRAALVLHHRRRIAAAISTEGEAMATKIRVLRGSSTGDWTVKGEPKALSKLVNDALKKEEKFVTFTQETGKARSVIAERVVMIWEE